MRHQRCGGARERRVGRRNGGLSLATTGRMTVLANGPHWTRQEKRSGKDDNAAGTIGGRRRRDAKARGHGARQGGRGPKGRAMDDATRTRLRVAQSRAATGPRVKRCASCAARLDLAQHSLATLHPSCPPRRISKKASGDGEEKKGGKLETHTKGGACAAAPSGGCSREPSCRGTRPSSGGREENVTAVRCGPIRGVVRAEGGEGERGRGARKRRGIEKLERLSSKILFSGLTLHPMEASMDCTSSSLGPMCRRANVSHGAIHPKGRERTDREKWGGRVSGHVDDRFCLCASLFSPFSAWDAPWLWRAAATWMARDACTARVESA